MTTLAWTGKQLLADDALTEITLFEGKAVLTGKKSGLNKIVINPNLTIHGKNILAIAIAGECRIIEEARKPHSETMELVYFLDKVAFRSQLDVQAIMVTRDKVHMLHYSQGELREFLTYELASILIAGTGANYIREYVAKAIEGGLSASEALNQGMIQASQKDPMTGSNFTVYDPFECTSETVSFEEKKPDTLIEAASGYLKNAVSALTAPKPCNDVVDYNDKMQGRFILQAAMSATSHVKRKRTDKMTRRFSKF